MEKDSVYDDILDEENDVDQADSAFDVIINNPYRLLGASTFFSDAQLDDRYDEWEENPKKFSTPFDGNMLGEPRRTKNNMEWALDNADSYVYKIFWFSDSDILQKLGNKREFVNFFSKKQSVNTTEYNTFLANYLFLCFFDRKFTLTDQWTSILNLINELSSVSVARFWSFFSSNKVEAIDSNRMAFLHNEFKDNILLPFKETVMAIEPKTGWEQLIHINKILEGVKRPQVPLSKLKNVVYEKLEKWFVKESEYVNNVLLANVSGVDANSLEEKLAITNAYTYIVKNIVPNFSTLVGVILPGDHSLNTKLRMMFSGKFLVVAKILTNIGLLHESLSMYKLFNDFFEDDYVDTEIDKLNIMIKREESTRMKENSPGTDYFTEGQDTSSAPGVGELGVLAEKRRKEFFKKKVKAGIDYKDVIQEVINKEADLLGEDVDPRERAPHIEIMEERRVAEEEQTAQKFKEAVNDLQHRHSRELQIQLKQMDMMHKESMRKWTTVILVLLALILMGFAALVFAIMNMGSTDEILGVMAGIDSEAIAQMELGLTNTQQEISSLEQELAEINATVLQLEASYDESGDLQYAEQYMEQKSLYDEKLDTYNAKIENYNIALEEYNLLKEQEDM